jgi:hypothetical protein
LGHHIPSSTPLFTFYLAIDIDPEDHPSVSDWESDSESDGYERGLDLDKPLDMDEWKEFDEEEDQEDPISHEEMLSTDKEAGLWDCSA